MHATEAVPRMLLHLDVNKTIVLKDSSKAIDEEAMICSLLAEFTVGVWDEHLPAMTYKEYVHQVLIPDDSADINIKSKREQEVSKFLAMLDSRDHPLKERVLNKQQAMREKFFDPITGKLNFCVFQSFYELLKYLRRQNIRFVILLRTFGNDLKEVVQELNSNPEGITISRMASFKKKELHFDEKGSIAKLEAIFETFLHSQEHFAVQDSWKEWHDDEERARSGKPFIYDATGSWHGVSNLSLFFDDNFTGEEKDIVNPIALDATYKPASELNGKMIFTVNPISAVLEDDYYVQRVKQALAFFGGKSSESAKVEEGVQ